MAPEPDPLAVERAAFVTAARRLLAPFAVVGEVALYAAVSTALLLLARSLFG